MVLDQVHVAGAGDFQLSKIELLRDPCPVNARKGEDYMESDDTNVQVGKVPNIGKIYVFKIKK